MEASVNGWHLDKRVPITLIVTLVMQTLAIVWWASRVESRLSVVEANQLSHTTTGVHSDAGERIARLEARQDLILQNNAATLRQLEILSAKIDQVLGQQ